MSLKDTIDYGDVVTDLGSLELESHAIRKSFQYDSYAGKTRFIAIVLSEPLPLQSRDAGHFTNTPKISTVDKIKSFFGIQGSAHRISKFTFRGRIVEHNSPHWFLPDPCDPAYAGGDSAELLKLIGMHTLFVSTEEYQLQAGKKLPNRGDLVLVDLENNIFGYNLQRGAFVDVIHATDAMHNITSFVGAACGQTLQASFAAHAGRGTGPAGYSGPTTPYVPGASRSAGGCGIRQSRRYDTTHPNGVKASWVSKIPQLVTGESLASPVPEAEFKISSPFGGRSGTHHAVDVAARTGTPLYAIADGKIIGIKTNCPAHGGSPCGPCPSSVTDRSRCPSRIYSQCACGGKMGNYVKLEHDAKGPQGQTIYTYYGHMASVSAGLTKTPPSAVKAGDQIGTVGMSGNTSGPHLHMQVHMPGFPGAKRRGEIDPVAYLMANTQNGTACGPSAPAVASAPPAPTTTCPTGQIWHPGSNSCIPDPP